MNKFNIDFLFGCPIYRVKIDPKSFNKEKMVKTIQANYKLDPARNKWDYGGSDFHHMHDDFKNKKFKWLDFDSLIPVYKDVFNAISRCIVHRAGYTAASGKNKINA